MSVSSGWTFEWFGTITFDQACAFVSIWFEPDREAFSFLRNLVNEVKDVGVDEKVAINNEANRKYFVGGQQSGEKN